MQQVAQPSMHQNQYHQMMPVLHVQLVQTYWVQPVAQLQDAAFSVQQVQSHVQGCHANHLQLQGQQWVQS
jgi:hypothetical protein